MYKPLIRSRMFPNSFGGGNSIKWSPNGVYWFWDIRLAIECALEDVKLGIIHD